MGNFNLSDKNIFGMSREILSLAQKAEENVKPRFADFEKVELYNTAKVLAAFQRHRVTPAMFAETTGYGYDDLGRDTLEKIFADVFGAEDALVRPGFVNGTHAITAALFSNVGPGDILLAATGTPYDTLRSVIGISGDNFGSLKFYGIDYKEVGLCQNGEPDIDAIKRAASDPRVKEVEVQRSSGYSVRPALSVRKTGEIAKAVHEVNPNAAVIVDNCYGEFTETLEPTEVGADLIAGSLIKNPGGSLAPTGGYVAGKKSLVERAAARLTTPGIGRECGSTVGGGRLYYQGLFMAPHVVCESLKTAVFAAELMRLCGYDVSPAPLENRSDIIQSISFGSPEKLSRFCRGIQSGSPVDSFVTPEEWDMPGYDDKVIMAAGTFVAGASIELSCDAPMRKPYTAFLQGGVTYAAGKLGVIKAADGIMRE